LFETIDLFETLDLIEHRARLERDRRFRTYADGALARRSARRGQHAGGVSGRVHAASIMAARWRREPGRSRDETPYATMWDTKL
jgi:hypothetical protein